jgi:phosphoribosylformylglycinamidine cyclo-ligase
MKYRDAGVDIARADAIKEALGRAVRSTWGAGVRPIRGGFCGVTEFPGGGLLAATMDGVGTKLHLAQAAGRVGDAAADLVYHGANDLIVHGARPVAFLDYIAQSRLDPDTVLAIVEGLARACGEVGAALLGGETAEMPDTYLPGVVDVAGCMLGVVPPGRLLDGRAVAPGDEVLALGSDGLHTNGFSLARRVLAASGLGPDDALPGTGGVRVIDALLAPHRWYGPALEAPLARGALHALAHVTGGGIAGNLVRVLPEDREARIEAGTWRWPPLFRWLVESGGVPLEDARTALNLGVGMVAVCAADAAGALLAEWTTRGERAWRIGVVRAGPRGVRWR